MGAPYLFCPPLLIEDLSGTAGGKPRLAAPVRRAPVGAKAAEAHARRSNPLGMVASCLERLEICLIVVSQIRSPPPGLLACALRRSGELFIQFLPQSAYGECEAVWKTDGLDALRIICFKRPFPGIEAFGIDDEEALDSHPDVVAGFLEHTRHRVIGESTSMTVSAAALVG